VKFIRLLSSDINMAKYIIPIEIVNLSSKNAMLFFYTKTECKYVHESECTHVDGVVSYPISDDTVFKNLIMMFCEKKGIDPDELSLFTHNGHREIGRFYWKLTMSELEVTLPWLD
jgi:hypothetical protein